MKLNYKYLRNFLAALLLIVYTLSPFKIYAPYLSYKINYNYISTVLCENKAKSKLQCQGKCYLKKELKKTSEEESKNKSTLKSLQQEEYLVSISFYFNSINQKIDSQNVFFGLKKYISIFPEYIAPPPQA